MWNYFSFGQKPRKVARVSSVQEQPQYQCALILHEMNQVVLFSFLHHPAEVKAAPPLKMITCFKEATCAKSTC